MQPITFIPVKQRVQRQRKLSHAASPPSPPALNVVDVTVLDIGDQALTWTFDGPTGIDGSVLPQQLMAKGRSDPTLVSPDSIASFDDTTITLLYGGSSGFDGTGTWDVEAQPSGMNALVVPESGGITGPVPPALVLVSADYDGSRHLTLTFDRAIDIDDFDVFQVSVNNSGDGKLYTGGGATLSGDHAVIVYMPIDDSSSEPGVFMNASDATGIVAVDNGGTWAGAISLVLPFP